MKYKNRIYKSGRNPRRFSDELENKILKLFDQGMSCRKIALEVDKQCTSITRVVKRNNRKLLSGKGSEHSGWKGGRGLKTGYWTVYNPTHPRALNIGRVFEHILIAEKMLGRMIPKTEPIHHKDLDKKNNDPNNLHVCKDHSEHQRIHADLEKIAKELYKIGIIMFENGTYKINKITLDNK